MNIPVEIISGFRNGFQEEHYLVDAIRRYLITQEEKQWLFDNGISIEDMLNGRVTMPYLKEIDRIYQRWNSILGFEAFGPY